MKNIVFTLATIGFLTALTGCVDLLPQGNNDTDEECEERTWYLDNDGDGVGNDTTATSDCEAPASAYVPVGGDCDDGDPAIGAMDTCPACAFEHPTHPERNDCDGDGWIAVVDCDDWSGALTDNCPWADADEDGFLASVDCDDQNAEVNPRATEACNGVDDNCDGEVDESLTTTWYRDADGDGYGLSSDTKVACTQPAGYAAQGGDCNDNDATKTTTCPTTTPPPTSGGLVDIGLCLDKAFLASKGIDDGQIYGMNKTTSADSVWFIWGKEMVSLFNNTWPSATIDTASNVVKTIAGKEYYCSAPDRLQRWDRSHELAFAGFSRSVTSGKFVDGFGPLGIAGLDPNTFLKVDGGDQSVCEWKQFTYRVAGRMTDYEDWLTTGNPTYSVICRKP